jgi:two-component system response regulator LytT
MENSTLKVVILDDDRNILSILTAASDSLFAQKGVKAEIRNYYDPEICLKEILSSSADLLLLDIDMPKIDGISFAKRLQSMGISLSVIFVSSMEDRVFETFSVHPFGFVRKSHFQSDFTPLIDSYLAARNQEQNREDVFVLKTGGKTISLKTEKIVYIEGKGKYQSFHVDGLSEPVTVRFSMEDLEKSLGPKGFLRIHKGYLVNILFIHEIGESEVALTNGISLPISRRKVTAIREEYLELLGKRNNVTLMK